MADNYNVSSSKPKAVTGAIYVAPAGTTLPTDHDSALNAAFKSVGYISDAGITNGKNIDSEKTKCYGGVVVDSTVTGMEDSFKFTMISAHNVEALKIVHGDDAVTVDSSTGDIKVMAGKSVPSEKVFVLEQIVDGKACRTVIPRGKLSDVGDITYKDNEPVGYEVTIEALADGSNGTHIDYIEG